MAKVRKEEVIVTESEFVAAEAALDSASDELDAANARADRAREALGRLQCRFSWRPESIHPGWPVLWCGRPAGHEGTHDARFYLEENPCEEFAAAVSEFALADRAAGVAGWRWLSSQETVEQLEGREVGADAWQEGELDRVLESMEQMEREEAKAEEDTDVVDGFDQYPLDGFWDPRWGSSLSETEDDEHEEQPPSHR